MTNGQVPGARPRIGIAFQGDPDNPASWSGVPSGLQQGLRAAGADPVPVDARFPGADRVAHRLGMSWAAATANPVFAAASGARASRALRAAGVDGTVAIGSGFTLAPALRAVTFEDMTVAQAVRREDPVYRELGERALRRWRQRQKLIYERSIGCCVTSRWVAESIHGDYGMPLERIHVVGLGRNVEADGVGERDWSVPRFIFAGLAWERKRGAAVVAAFTALRERHPAATLDLVGDHPRVEVDGVTGHGPLRLDSGPEQRRYSELLARATCFVMPSSYEPFGIAYLDAGAAGIASIGTTVGGARDAVGPGGVLVEPGDDQALLEAMLELAVPETARDLGRLARQNSALYTWRAVGERLLRALRPPQSDVQVLSEFLPLPKNVDAT
ncbi:MAG TPA: glycosyltransferase family 4 protein [Solirubrobacterales bacterium]|nr:glycosyltransferase family 4 protein [Solirubrobacterales bacterium]